MGLNKAVLMGRLTADPEQRVTPSGISVTRFSIAVDRRFDKEKTDFINIVAWRQTAEFVTKYFSKGDMIAVAGSIQTDSYTDKDGNKRTSFEIVADEVSFCGSKKNEQPAQQTNFATYDETFSDNGCSDIDDDELPF